MNSYKRLDNLCRDMNGIGVTGYIEDMKSAANGAYYVPGWKDDYFQLKQYRYIRNRISHENDVDENSLCSTKDVDWLKTFYQRIITLNDPLALYHQAKKQYVAYKNAAPKIQRDSSSPSNQCNTGKPKKKPVDRATIILLALACAAVAVFVLIAFFYTY